MQYSVVGFPRIGERRELKFATEKYFRGDISSQELSDTVFKLRAAQWEIQKKAGASYIPSNDFSLYDGMLDTAFMLHAVPKRYRALHLDDAATYFAMARGYQKDGKDVTALTMKKWFNTNYHYMVPELNDDTRLKLCSDTFLESFLHARSIGIETKPVIIGPFTFLKLARCGGNKGIEDFASEAAAAYSEILKKCAKNNVKWLQIDEPYLVTDLTEADIELFCRMYDELLKAKTGTKVLLQTYFGDVRDCYDKLITMPFDGIGLDFTEGRQTEKLLKTSGFPKNRTLFAGLINGKNIWKCDFSAVLEQIKELRTVCGEIVLSTSCSLLHVPYTVKNENKSDSDVISHFSFAYEKLEEMKELCRLSSLTNYSSDPSFCANRELFRKRSLYANKQVQQNVASLTDADFKRAQPRNERRALQSAVLRLPPLPTTTIGSFPQTKEVKQNRAKFRSGAISEEVYRSNIKRYISDCIKLQEKIGLDVLVHGESERNDMVEYFGENLNGYVFTDNAWVQSYGTRAIKPPIIFGDISRERPITVDYIKYANSLTDKDVKGMLTGPVTILNWSFPREDISSEEMMYQIALALREEVLELEKAGVRIIQIDEAALREKLPLRKRDRHSEYLDFAIKAFRLCHAQVKPETQIHTHMCYSEFEDIIPEIDSMDADVFTFEASRSKLTILDALQQYGFGAEVGPGVYDIHSPRVPGVDEIEKAILLMLKKIPKENLWINPDCGLKTRGEEETEASLRNLVTAAKNIRNSVF